jgi:hypothetical protein
MARGLCSGRRWGTLLVSNKTQKAWARKFYENIQKRLNLSPEEWRNMYEGTFPPEEPPTQKELEQQEQLKRIRDARDDMLRREQEAALKQALYTGSGSSTTPISGMAASPISVSLSKDQLRIAQKLGLNPADYAGYTHAQAAMNTQAAMNAAQAAMNTQVGGIASGLAGQLQGGAKKEKTAYEKALDALAEVLELEDVPSHTSLTNKATERIKKLTEDVKFWRYIVETGKLHPDDKTTTRQKKGVVANLLSRDRG